MGRSIRKVKDHRPRQSFSVPEESIQGCVFARVVLYHQAII